jgi:hypothetical protein
MTKNSLLPPVADFMFPALSERGQIGSAIETDTLMTGSRRIGAFAAAAARR